MKTRVKIFWEYVWGNSFFFDQGREWSITIIKEYDHSRLSDLKQILRLKALARVLS